MTPSTDNVPDVDHNGGGLRHRHREHPFVTIDSATVNDARLSFRARGVLAYLLNKPDGWVVRAETIAKDGTEGRAAIEAALRELRAAGYYRVERRRIGGKWRSGGTISETPVPEWAERYAAAEGDPRRQVASLYPRPGGGWDYAPVDNPDSGLPVSGDQNPEDQDAATLRSTETHDSHPSSPRGPRVSDGSTDGVSDGLSRRRKSTASPAEKVGKRAARRFMRRVAPTTHARDHFRGEVAGLFGALAREAHRLGYSSADIDKMTDDAIRAYASSRTEGRNTHRRRAVVDTFAEWGVKYEPSEAA